MQQEVSHKLPAAMLQRTREHYNQGATRSRAIADDAFPPEGGYCMSLIATRSPALAIREEAQMNDLRVWIIFAWISLPTVMFGGYSLLHLINRGNSLTPFQVTWVRAGHAHAGVLVLMSLLTSRSWTRHPFPLRSGTRRARHSL
jgi:hypothetical protein